MARTHIRILLVPASGILLAVLSMFLSVAQAQSSPPAEEAQASPMGAVIFGVLFVLFCVGFARMVWRGDKTKKSETSVEAEAQPKK